MITVTYSSGVWNYTFHNGSYQTPINATTIFEGTIVNNLGLDSNGQLIRQSASGGGKYLHIITYFIDDNNYQTANVLIVNDSADSFTLDSFKTYLLSNGFTSASNLCRTLQSSFPRDYGTGYEEFWTGMGFYANSNQVLLYYNKYRYLLTLDGSNINVSRTINYDVKAVASASHIKDVVYSL